MKKILLIPALLLICIMLMGSSCAGASIVEKNRESNINGLNRHVEIRTAIGNELVWSFGGLTYIDANSKPGNVTILYKPESASEEWKKVDVIGLTYNVIAIEDYIPPKKTQASATVSDSDAEAAIATTILSETAEKTTATSSSESDDD